MYCYLYHHTAIVSIYYCDINTKMRFFLMQYGMLHILKIEINNLKLTEIGNIGQISRVVFVVVQSCAKWLYRTYYHLYTV